MATRIASAKETVLVDPNGPTTVVGERCNALGYRNVAKAARDGKWSVVVNRAIKQKEAGAHIVNVNMVGVKDQNGKNVSEVELLPRAVRAILEAVDVPLSIDFGDPEAMVAAIKMVRKISGPKSRPIINSINGESQKLDVVLAIAKEHDVPMFLMPCDDRGIPETAERRVEVARNVIEYAEKNYGIPATDFIVDCICIGVGTAIDSRPGAETMRTLALVKKELGLSCMLGASNAGFGLPNKKLLDAYYLAIAISHGMNVALTDPTHEKSRWALLCADAINGTDEGCMEFLTAYREEQAVLEPAPVG